MTITVSNQILDDYINQIQEAIYQAHAMRGGFTSAEKSALQQLVDAMTPIYDLRARTYGGERVGGRPGSIDLATWTRFLSEYERAVVQLRQPAAAYVFTPPSSGSATTGGPGTMLAPMSYAERVAASKHVLPGTVDKSPKTDIEDAVDAVVDEAVSDNGVEPTPVFVPSFYEQHKTKLLIGGGIAALLLVGGGLLAARRSGKLTSKHRSKRNPVVEHWEEEPWWAEEAGWARPPSWEDHDFEDPQFRYLEERTLADVVGTHPYHQDREERMLMLTFSDEFRQYIRDATGEKHPSEGAIIAALLDAGIPYREARQYAAGAQYPQYWEGS
jgi:hypothetical protein